MPRMTKKELETKATIENKKIAKESEPESESEEEEDEESASEQESSSEEEKPVEKAKKPRKPKETTSDIISKLESENASLKKIESEIAEIKKSLIQKEKEHVGIQRTIDKLTAQLVKSNDNDSSKVKNTKKKEFKPKPIPTCLIKFLGLEDDAQLPRPTVLQHMIKKFKEKDAMEKGVITIDAKSAKVLGAEEGRQIGFKEYNKFLSEIYLAFEEKNKKVNLG